MPKPNAFFAAACLAAPLLSAPSALAEDSAWVSMLNGKTLEGWTPYFSGKKLGNPLVNPDSTFGVTPEGWLDVNVHLPYDSTHMGHLFYTKTKGSYYMVRAVYRFTKDVLGPGWTGADNIQNNGLMVHCPAPSAMNGADYPTSVEVQLIGPKNTFFNRDLVAQGWKYGTTANLCLPGVTVNLDGSDLSSNCHHANYPTAWKNTEIPWEDKDGWSDATVRVLGDSLIQHYIHGAKVHEYTRIRKGGQPLKEGYLAVQAEGSSTQFKSLQWLDLTGCMDKTSPAYRTYFVKSNPTACSATGIRSGKKGSSASRGKPMARLVVTGKVPAAKGSGGPGAGETGAGKAGAGGPDSRESGAVPRDVSGRYVRPPKADILPE